ncbi:MAG: glycerol-3-phosphate acyltransferase, partial [Myxococcales bacterium]|nr:glycerol-3-phosphate acyltransferase [Myxococcales bacterium]
FAYALAATPTSYLVARFIHKSDARLKKDFVHSASTIWRTWSKKTGIAVFVLDFLKGFIPCAIAFSLMVPVEIIAIIGLFAVLGHCFSVWLMMSGGRGASTSAGAMVFVSWPIVVLGLIVFLMSVLLGARVERASFYAVLATVCAFSIWSVNNLVFIGVLVMGVVVLWRHRSFIFIKP